MAKEAVATGRGRLKGRYPVTVDAPPIEQPGEAFAHWTLHASIEWRKQLVAADRLHRFGPAALRLAVLGGAGGEDRLAVLRHGLSTAFDDAVNAFDILIIDGVSTGVGPPPHCVSPRSGDQSHIYQKVFRDGVVLSYSDVGRAWLVFDDAKRRAVVWAADLAKMPEWAITDHVRSVLHACSSGAPWGLFHAAVLAEGNRGVVVTGASGAGKSTLTATAVSAGLDTAGDDFVLLQTGNGEVTAHALFDSLKLDQAALARFPAWAARIVNPQREPDEKAVLRLSDLAGRIASGVAVCALVVARIGPGSESSLIRCPPQHALRALAPSTAFLLRSRGEEVMMKAARLARALPTYALTIGSDPRRAVEALTRLICASGQLP